uniref:Portal protein, HK97 family n=1 Tax=uncultured marine virus TaxID=186617 RepID=A0A0F7L418_9VIRU|nr:portal protein, HK97 family [uncultured marine virus]
MLGFGKKEPEKRARSVEKPDTPISSRSILEFFGIDQMSGSGVSVNLNNALTVPAVMAAVEFLSSTIAGLPLNVYKRTESGREKQKSGLQLIIHDAVSEEMTSFDWRKYSMDRTLTNGRSLTYIERDSNGRVQNLFPLNPSTIKIIRTGMKKRYVYQYGKPEEIIYESNEIIDIPFALDQDGLSSISPIMKNADTIGLAIAATNYGSKFFNNGGVPPFVLMGKFESGKGMQRASDDLQKAIKKQSKENRLALTLPAGHELKSIGADPEKSQLVELKRFLIEEIARIFSLPPVFLQDLTHGTFSNTEQQDLHLVKHTLRRWVVQIEQEMNLKLFGRDNNEFYVEFNMDGLLRGDFTSRMAGYAQGIQNAVLTPNEARAQENRPNKDNADELLIQGATVPLGSQPNTTNEVPTNG